MMQGAVLNFRALMKMELATSHRNVNGWLLKKYLFRQNYGLVFHAGPIS